MFSILPLFAASLFLPTFTLTLTSASPASLLPRQTTDPRIPAACTTPCVPAFPMYDACLYKQPGCEQVCWADNWANFLQCQQCLLDNSDHVIKGQVDSANNVLRQLAEDCATNGTVVVGSSVSATTAPISTAPRPSATAIDANPQNNHFAANQPQASSAAGTVAVATFAPAGLIVGLGAIAAWL